MTLLLSDDDVRQVADMGGCIDAIEKALGEQRDGHAVVPPRLNLSLEGTFLRLMPAQLGRSDLMGYKTFHGSIGRGVRYLVVLCRLSDGEVLALIDAAYLTAFRTGATSGLATRHMAKPGRTAVGVIGSGLEAETNLRGIAAVREITNVRVYSPNPSRREDFAARMTAALGIDVVAVHSAQEAVEPAGIVVVATNTGNGGPVAFEGAWMQPGQHVVSIGSTGPALREADADTFGRADRVVLDVAVEQMVDECGDVIALDEPGRARLREARLLQDVLGMPLPDETDRSISLFKSVGTAVQDLAAAQACLEAAGAAGVGTDVGQVAALKEFSMSARSGQQ